MFRFLKKNGLRPEAKTDSEAGLDEEDRGSVSQKEESSTVVTATGFSATSSAQASIEDASRVFSKPANYTGNRQLFDSGTAKANVKKDAFAGGAIARDPYTGDMLELRKIDAKRKYGENWVDHLAEGDHITPLEKIYEKTKNKAFLKQSDIREIGNADENLQTVSRRFNNAKRKRTNEEFVNDDAYMEKTGVKLSGDAKQRAIDTGKASEASIDKKIRYTSAKNALKTGHEAGMSAAANAGQTVAVISTAMNCAAVIRGEKTAKDALADIAVDTGKATVSGYVMGGGLTTLQHSLSSSSAPFLKALSQSNAPGQVITAVMLTGNTLARYGRGEISTQECLIDLGEKGLNFATAGYSMAVGQALIPIPVVGAAVGALVGGMLTSQYYHTLLANLQQKQLEHEERQRIIAECAVVAEQARAFKEELESYLSAYFKEYQGCFDEALSEMQYALQTGDANGVISGANRITRKLGGRVMYETVDDCGAFLLNGSLDIL